MKHLIPLLTCISAVSLPLTGCSDLHFLSKCPSCEEKDSEISVAFDWSMSPDAAPEGMSVLFYPVDNDPFWRFELPDNGEMSPSRAVSTMWYPTTTTLPLFFSRIRTIMQNLWSLPARRKFPMPSLTTGRMRRLHAIPRMKASR